MSETIILALISSGVLSAVVTGVISIITKAQDKTSAKHKEILEKIDKIESQTATLKTVQLSITRDRLAYICKSYIKENKISMQELEAVEDLYKAYSDLGGNSFVHELIEKVRKLPIEE